MNSKSTILNNVRRNKPSIQTEIEMSQFSIGENENLVEFFCSNLIANDGSCSILDSTDDLRGLLDDEIDGKLSLDLSGTIQSQQDFAKSNLTDPKCWEHLEVLVVPCNLGVAENGAIWVEEEMLQNIRILPFIVERTVFILRKENIVPTMHQAYQRLGSVKTGFGTFVAGPSKTGDIEQNLVVGAHGALSHFVVLV